MKLGAGYNYTEEILGFVANITGLNEERMRTILAKIVDNFRTLEWSRPWTL